MKIKLLIILAIILIVSLTNKATTETKSVTTKTVAITQIVDHPSLNEAKKGIIKGINDSGYKEGINLKLVETNAQGNISLATQIAEKL